MKRQSDKSKTGTKTSSISRILIVLAVVFFVAGVILLMIEPIKRHNRKKIAGEALDAITNKIESADGGEITFTVPATGNEVPGEERELIPQEAPIEEADLIELGAIGIISIPKIDIRYTVWDEVTEVSLRYGLCHYEESVIPGETGNATILGHNYKDGSMFHYLGELEAGDEVCFTGVDGTKMTFYVTDSLIISADDLMSYAEGDITDSKQLTLVTCTYEYGRTGWRRVVICKLAE